MGIKKISMLGTALCVIMLNCISFIFSAQAQTFDQHIPTYGLYCQDTECIKSGTVKFNMTDSQLLDQCVGIKKSEYRVAATDREVEFTIPFIALFDNIPSIAVTVNEQKIEGSVWYGESTFWSDFNFDPEKTYSPVLDESIVGTLYTVVPDNDTVTISLSFIDRKCFIYETSDKYTSSHSANGNRTWTLQNALSKQKYRFFVVGESAGHVFTSSCAYQATTLTCKNFIDEQYEKFKGYYEEYDNVTPNCFYSIINNAILSNTGIEFNELFFHSIDTYRLNAYKFKVSLETDSVIRYEIPVYVQRNSTFKPLVYSVEHIQTVHCPTTYIAELNNDIPYMIESSIDADRNGVTYTAETTEDFNFVFSSSEKPVSTVITKSNDASKRTVLIICYIVGSIALTLSVIMLCVEVCRHKVKKCK